uniref:Uncharacterized protein n=1 Tax=Acrobeloides nanus TaxID=290746 RepID=A0A914D6K1_9BILA
MFERALMTPWDVFYQISGALALWVSISMIAILEMVELLYLIFTSKGVFPPKTQKVRPSSGFSNNPLDSVSSGFSPYSAAALASGDLAPPPAAALSPDSYVL